MRSAAVYERGKYLIVHAWSKTVTGIGVATEPFLSLRADADADLLGKAVTEALASSSSDLEHPTDWKGLQRPLLAAARVKTWRAFVEGARYVLVIDEGEKLTLVPERNMGRRDGFQDVGFPRLHLSLPCSPVDIGRAVKQALAAVESGGSLGRGLPGPA